MTGIVAGAVSAGVVVTGMVVAGGVGAGVLAAGAVVPVWTLSERFLTPSLVAAPAFSVVSLIFSPAVAAAFFISLIAFSTVEFVASTLTELEGESFLSQPAISEASSNDGPIIKEKVFFIVRGI